MTTPTLGAKAAAVSALLLMTAACASVPQPLLEARLGEAVAERTGQTVERQEAAAIEGQVAALLAEPLDRDAALRVALAANRSFQAEFAALGVAAADYHAALVVPNPVFDAELLWPSGGGRPAWDLGLSQSVMALLTRSARRAIAESTLEARERESLERVLTLMHAVERAWVDAVTDTEVAALLVTAVEVTAAGVDTAEALHEAGNLPRIDLVREQRLHAHTRLRAARAEAQAHASREALLRALGLQEHTEHVLLPERLPSPPDVGDDVDALERVTVTASLQLAALEAEIVAAARAARRAPGPALRPPLERGLQAARARAGD
ncbi:MAG: TolC family protein, partial [Gammaproteobacteria bacterium]|nr:TolC family protein [Gammaproteobacteria bacterium]